MKELRFLDELVQRYPVLGPVKGDILKAYEIMRECYENGGKLMIAGNGGSCSDSEHIAGELMKGFVKRRPVSEELARALKTADPQMGEILYAAAAAKALGVTVIGLTGRDGGRIKDFSHVSIVVPEQETFKIQELHLPVYHALCLMLEDHFYES